ncbi:hypothetical protein B7463_g10759, partial [Scytalidium lignicola]
MHTFRKAAGFSELYHDDIYWSVNARIQQPREDKENIVLGAHVRGKKFKLQRIEESELETTTTLHPFPEGERRAGGMLAINEEHVTTIKLAKIEAGHNVLDIGCGTGLLAFRCKDLVGSDGYVVGVGLSPKMIQLARSALQKKKDLSGVDF